MMIMHSKVTFQRENLGLYDVDLSDTDKDKKKARIM
jgi:hypothetical protein